MTHKYKKGDIVVYVPHKKSEGKLFMRILNRDYKPPCDEYTEMYAVFVISDKYTLYGNWENKRNCFNLSYLRNKEYGIIRKITEEEKDELRIDML